MKKHLLALVLLAAAAPSGNSALLADFANRLLVQKNPKAAFEYAAPDMIQHNPVARDGRDGAIALTTLLFTKPGAYFTPLQLLADGDLVFLHYRGQLAPGTAASVAELYRVAGGRFVEHWDAFEPDRDAPGPADTSIASGDENRALIEDFAKRLYRRRDVGAAFTEDAAPDLIQHEAGPQGRDAAVKALAPMFADPAEHYTIAHILAAGPYGVIHVHALNNRTKTDAVVFDILRINKGRIAEIWTVIQAIPSARPNPRPPV